MSCSSSCSRYWITAIVGAGDLTVDEEKGIAYCDEKVVFKEGDLVSIDGLSGNVFVGPVEVIDPEITGEFAEYLKLCDNTEH
jgi:pyruvate,orthophosphate dikinase